jgi:septum formation protein
VKIVLASASPRRRLLLAKLGLKFVVAPSNVKEVAELKGMPIEELVQRNALMKARAIAGKEQGALIIGCDTDIYFKGKVIGKPKNAEDAKRILREFSNKWHSIISGIAIIDTATGREITDFEKTKVKVKRLSEQKISKYVMTGEPLDKAGAYGIQEKGRFLIEKFDGSYSNIVGLPLEKLTLRLKEFGVHILRKRKLLFKKRNGGKKN